MFERSFRWYIAEYDSGHEINLQNIFVAHIYDKECHLNTKKVTLILLIRKQRLWQPEWKHTDIDECNDDEQGEVLIAYNSEFDR